MTEDQPGQSESVESIESVVTMVLIVGLGNPGPKYAGSRHNFGFMVINELARRWDIAVDNKKFDSRFGTGLFGERKVALQKPSTFMNASGQAVVGATNFYKIPPEDVIVIMDDLALPLGCNRIRARGSAGGHKGLSDIMNRLGTSEIARLRLGIGSPPRFIDPVDFVLARFLPEEQALLSESIAEAADAVEMTLRDGINRAMDRYNRKADNNDETE